MNMYDVEEWILQRSDSVFMEFACGRYEDGTTTYLLRMPGVPGVVAHLRLDEMQAFDLREVFLACLEADPHVTRD